MFTKWFVWEIQDHGLYLRVWLEVQTNQIYTWRFKNNDTVIWDKQSSSYESICLEEKPLDGCCTDWSAWQFYWVWLFREWGTREARRMSSISIRLLSLDFCSVDSSVWIPQCGFLSVDSSVWIPHLLWCYISRRSDHLRLQLPHSDKSKRSVCIHPPQMLDMHAVPCQT